MFTFIRRIRHTLQKRQSLGDLLLRADDHLLDDIGLTRAEVEAMIWQDETAPPAPPPMHTSQCREC